MAADRYHEQNVVMTKELVQLIELRREEQNRYQQHSMLCQQLSSDMIRLKIAFVEVLQESYPIRLKSAPGQLVVFAWSDDGII